MKKNLLTFFAVVLCFGVINGQTTLLVEAPQNNQTTTNVRAPSGVAASAYLRAAALVLQNELTNIPSGSTITVFGFTLSNATSVTMPVSGNFTVYLENTTDVTYLKGNAWAGILTGMTVCYANIMTIPLSATSTSITLTLSTPFVYTGGGIYVAYDWASNGPFSTVAATYLCENVALNPGCVSANGTTPGPTNTTTTNFRPSFLFGIANPYNNDVQVLGIESPGRIASTLNTPHTISAVIKNGSSGPLNSINVNLNVTGANVFTDTQVISSLAAGATTTVSFLPFNPLLPGAQTVSVSVANDQINSNNSRTYPQLVNCDTWGRNPASGSYTFNSVGFAAAAGILVSPFLNPVPSTLVGMRGAVSSNTPSVGNNVYGVLLNATGGIIATTNTITITTPMLSTFLTFNFATPQNLTAATNYFLGFAQTTAVNAIAYYPAGTQATPYLPTNIYGYTGINGGAVTFLPQNFGYFGLEAIFGHSVTVSAPSQTISCGNSATLNAVSSTNYSWSTGATTSSITVNTATANSIYSVVATNTLGCSATATTALVVSPLPLVIASTPTLVCAGDLVTLQASGASSFTWTSTSGTLSGNSIAETLTTTVNYSVSGSEPSGCVSNTIINVFVNPLPVVNVSVSNPSICLGSSTSLNASGNAISYSWSSGQTNASIVESPSVSTVYTVTGLNGVGCARSTTVGVIVDSFTPAITAPTSICNGQTTSLTTTGIAPFLWSTGSVFNSITVSPSITSVYQVSSKGANGCTGSNSVTILVNSTPSVTAATTRSAICRGEATTLTVSGATTYSWNNAATTPSIVVSPSTTIVHFYSVTGTNNEGCSSEAQIAVRVSFCTSLSEMFDNKQITAFPNPTSGKLSIKLGSIVHSQELMIFNTLGELINKTPANHSEIDLDLSAFANGIYFVKLMNDGKTINTLKVIKH